MRYEYILSTQPNSTFIIMIVVVVAAVFAICALSSDRSGIASYNEPASLDDIAADETRLRAEARRYHAQAERDEALLKAETARVSLEDIRSIIKHERGR